MDAGSLNGFYTARFFSDVEMKDSSHQLTTSNFVVCDERISGVGEGGTIFFGIFKFDSDGFVDFQIVLDLSLSNHDVRLYDGNGGSGREPQMRSGRLKATAVDGKLTLSGEVKFGAATAGVVIRRVAEFRDAHI